MRQIAGLEQHRNDKVQLLRAISIIAVVLLHTCPGGEWGVYCRPFINFPVATFIFLSGYLSCVDNDNWAIFIKKRVLRVIIPYVIWTILYCIAKKAWTPEALLYNLIAARGHKILFFIIVYIQFVLLTPFIGKLAKSHYRWAGWCIAPIAVLIFKYYPALSGIEYPSTLKIIIGNCCLVWFSFYYLGIILGNGILTRRDRLALLVVLYCFALLLQISEGYWLFQLGSDFYIRQTKLSAMLSTTIFLLIAYWYLKSSKKMGINPALKLIGDYSFGIYLSHMMIKQILTSLPYYSNLPFVANSMVILLFSFLLVYCGDKLLGVRCSKWLGFK